MTTMPAHNFSAALAILGVFQRVSPVRPLRTFIRATEERFRPRQPVPHAPVERKAQAAVLGRDGAGLHQQATIILEHGRGQTPTIVLGGFVPDAAEQVLLLRHFFLRTGDLYYIKYPRTRFSLDLVCAQLDDLVTELAARGEPPVIFAVSFGGGIALEWLRRARLSGITAPLAGLILVSPVACVEDIIQPGANKPATLLGRALKPYLGNTPPSDAAIEKSRAIFARMFEAGVQNKIALLALMTRLELERLRTAVRENISSITPEGARERVQAMCSMQLPTAYFSPALLPLTEVPVLVLFAEREDAVLDAASPTRFAFTAALRAYFPQGRVQHVAALPGTAPVQHASLIFHVFEFLPHLSGFYTRLKHAKFKSAA